jgi:hypothetical protein
MDLTEAVLIAFISTLVFAAVTLHLRSRSAALALQMRSTSEVEKLRIEGETAKHTRFSDLSQQRRSHGNQYETTTEVPQWGMWVEELTEKFGVPIEILDALYEDALPPEIATLLENPLVVGFLKGKLQSMMTTPGPGAGAEPQGGEEFV